MHFIHFHILRSRRFILFLKSNALFAIFSITLFIATLAPLRCPTGKGYSYLDLNDIKDDLQICPVTRRSDEFKLCPLINRELSSFKHANINANKSYLAGMFKTLKLEAGGRWYPKTCTSWQRVAVIVPYRNREQQLLVFLQNIHPYLQAQQLDYGIFVIEQSEKEEFNRGKLFNIGYLEAAKELDFCCFVFHDVDLLPESPQHTYGCSEDPRHMCSALDTFRYVLPYPGLFGGVVAFTKEQFTTINGYSNLFFGWGGEDDDLFNRVISRGMNIRRWAPYLSRYTMLKHRKEIPNPNRIKLLQSGKERIDSDGLSSLDYRILKTELKPLYKHLLVDVKPK